jgi:hypothetical protein
MAQIAAKTIKRIKAAGPSDAGSHFVMQMLDRNDQEVSIAIPIGMIFELIGQMATAHAKNWEKLGLNMSFAEMLELTGFQAGRDQPDTGKIILRLTSGEAAFSFRLSPDIAEALRGELAKVAAVTGQTNKGR